MEPWDCEKRNFQEDVEISCTIFLSCFLVVFLTPFSCKVFAYLPVTVQCLVVINLRPTYMEGASYHTACQDPLKSSFLIFVFCGHPGLGYYKPLCIS